MITMSIISQILASQTILKMSQINSHFSCWFKIETCINIQMNWLTKNHSLGLCVRWIISMSEPVQLASESGFKSTFYKGIRMFSLFVSHSVTWKETLGFFFFMRTVNAWLIAIVINLKCFKANGCISPNLYFCWHDTQNFASNVKCSVGYTHTSDGGHPPRLLSGSGSCSATSRVGIS